MAPWRRTHTCGELRDGHIGQTVTLNGWVNTTRAYNDQVFVDLRDRYGLTQVVFEAEDSTPLFDAAHELRSEWVLSVTGKVRARLPGATNPKLATGAVEVEATELRILNRCPTPPFEVQAIPQAGGFGDPAPANEDLRLEYRYLDLRKPSLHRTLAVRHRLNKAIRDYLDERGFLEVETPLLGRSTPEGARDYLVPSRVFPGTFFALPQSPQLYKQLLMVAGYDRYFQIAHCLRDEDLRADRQPEFTQLDLEMSFVDVDDVLGVIEGMTAEVFRRCLGLTIPTPFGRLRYQDALLRYGSDKPDLRFGLEIVDATDLAPQTTFTVFQEAAASGGRVRGLNAKGAAAGFSRKGLDELTALVGQYKAKGLAWLKVEPTQMTGPIARFLGPEAQEAFRRRMQAEAGDLLLFVADAEDVVCAALGALRSHLGAALKLYTNWWDRRAAAEEQARTEQKEEEKRARKEEREAVLKPLPFQFEPNDFAIAWVVDFPSFIKDEEEKRWVANHHPFTAPRDEDLAILESDPGKVRAKAYDLVINGYEIGGGSIRIHDPEVQARLFRRLGMSDEQARGRFGFLLEALKSGAPPHGGIALGLDRFAMILAGTNNIRDVIAFPKNQRARDLMTGAPAEVDPKQIRELGLESRKS
jgi:aspartyl-tRNA synthetase